MSTTNSKRRKWLRLVGLILGIIGAGGLALIVWVVLAFSWGRIVEPIHWLYVLVSGLIIIGSVAVAWKWELIGGVALIVEGLPPIVIGTLWVTQYGLFALFLLVLPVGLPLLICGILFTLSWREGQKHLISPSD